MGRVIIYVKDGFSVRKTGINRLTEELSHNNTPSALFFPDNTVFPRKILISGIAGNLGP